MLMEQEVDRGAGVGLAVTVLGVAALLVAADSLVVAPLLPALAADFGVPVGTAAIVIPAYQIPYGLCQLIMGPIGDRLGKLRVMRWAALVFALATAGCGLAHTLLQLVVARALAGVFAAAIIPLGIAYFGEMVPFDRRQGALAGFLTYYSVGSGLSVLLGGAVTRYLDWRPLFVVYGVVSLLVAWAMGRLAADPPGRPGVSSFRSILRAPILTTGLGFAVVYGALLFGAFSFLGVYLDQRYHVNYLVTGLLLSPFGLAPVAGKGLLGPLRRRLGERWVVVTGFALMAAGYAVVLLSSASLALFAVGTALMGLGYISGHTMMLALATEVVPGAKGRATSLYVFCLFGAGGIGTEALRRVLVQRGPEAVVGIAAIGLALLAAVAGPLLGRALGRVGTN